MSSEFRDMMERFAESLTEKEFIEFEMMSPAERIEAMKNAGVLRDDMNNGGIVRKKFQGGSGDNYFTYDPDALAGVQTDVTRFAPFIESAAAAFIPELEKVSADALTTQDLSDLYRGVASQNKLQQQAIQQQLTQAGLGQATFGGAAGTLSALDETGSGIAAFEPFIDESQRLAGATGPQGQITAAGLTAAREPFMSPYQQQVIDATKASFNQQRARDRLTIADQARKSGAFGGARQGVQEGVYDAETALGLAGLESTLLQQGFQQADTARQAEMANQQALASAVPGLQQGIASNLMSLGAGQQALQQTQSGILEQQARERIFDPQQRMGAFAQSFAPLVQGIGPQSVFSTSVEPPPSPLDTIIGVGGVGAGLLGGLGKILGTG
mgnify:CR=1 FL=1|tara:strand:- start:8170 stop:9321 length:1152 start_codon:yes stop_codon:yes gene_type:complete